MTDAADFDADVCVIGAGAAGFSCAVSLLKSGLNVLVLEGGLEIYNKAAADQHISEISGFPHTGVHQARERIIGGTTTKWGGQALPFMPEDFEERSHVNFSGWPLKLQELMPYYKKAEDILGTDVAVPYNFRPWKHRHIKEPQFSGNSLELFVTKWCRTPNFALQHGQKIAQSDRVTLLYNASVVELIPNQQKNAVHSIRICSLDGKQGKVRAKYIIAAGGALESVRLFLASDKFGKNGLGNDNDLVGKYFQDHVAAIAGQIIPISRKKFQNIFDPFYLRGYKYFPRIKLSPSQAMKSRILHASAQVVFTEEKHDPVAAMKLALANFRGKERIDLRQLKGFINPAKLFRITSAMLRWKVGKRGSSPKTGPIWLEIHSEQEPSAESRVTLSKGLDAMGMPRIRLDWNVSDLTVRTIKETAKLVQKEFKNAGIGEVLLDPWIKRKTISSRRWLTDVFHQAGGLRMSETEAEGVVDPSCKVFGIDNLYVASSAVFPTSSFSNPTMTTIALSIRVCETIEQRLNRNIN